MKENSCYIQTIIKERLYEKANQIIHPPTAAQLREIATIPMMAEHVSLNHSTINHLHIKSPLSNT